MKDKQKFNLLHQVLIIILLFFAGSLGYYFGQAKKEKTEEVKLVELPSKQTKQIENPELYVDKKKAISFVYPADTHRVKVDSEAEYSRTFKNNIPDSFKVSKNYSPPKLNWALKIEEKSLYQGRYGEESPLSPFAVWVFENSDNLSIQEWYEKYWYYPFIWGDAVQPVIEEGRPNFFIEIDGADSYMYDAGSGPRGYHKLVYIPRGDKVYLFSLHGGQKHSLEDQILDSFRFLIAEAEK